MATDDTPQVAEVVPGDYDVRLAGRRVRVLVPAGVGVPGVDEDELAGAVVTELVRRGAGMPDVVDVSSLLREDPQLLQTIVDRLEADA